jgi:hypothetical protein
MTRGKGKPRISARDDGKFALEIGKQRHELTFEETFAYGHAFLKSKESAVAAGIFKTLLKSRGVDRSVMVMLALCEAEMDCFESCQQTLGDAFVGRDEPLVERLLSAFVYYKLGMPAEVVRELTVIGTDRRDLPVICLVLGDVFQRMRRSDEASSWWKRAIRRDEQGGPVAVTAQGELEHLKKRADVP